MAANNGAHKRIGSNDKHGSFALRRLIAIITGVAFFASLMAAAPAIATDDTSSTGDQVCQGLDSGKIDTTGNPKTVTLTAPEGKLIDGYCVKAGSENNGDGPVYVTVNPPVKTLTISYPGGKDISHYSVSYSDAPPPPYECPMGTVWTDADGDGKVDEGECNTPPPPPYECPMGTVWTDADGDGKVDEGECNTPPPPPVVDACPGMPGTQLPGTVCTTPPPPVVDVCPNMPGNQPVATVCVIPTPTPTPIPTPEPESKEVRAAVKKLDKCRTAGDMFAVRKERGVVYYADGQRIREGVWLKTGGDLKVVVKAKAASGRFNLVGKDRWVLRFTKKPCGTPTVPVPTGAPRMVA